MVKIKPSEITPEEVYLSRRRFIKAGALAAGSLLLAACGVPDGASPGPAPTAGPGPAGADLPTPSAATDELGSPLTSFEAIANYNNYYEFTTSKEGVARLAEGLAEAFGDLRLGSDNSNVHEWRVCLGGVIRGSADGLPGASEE